MVVVFHKATTFLFVRGMCTGACRVTHKEMKIGSEDKGTMGKMSVNTNRKKNGKRRRKKRAREYNMCTQMNEEEEAEKESCV